MTAKPTPGPAWPAKRTRAGNGSRSCTNPLGAPAKKIRELSLMPSFLDSGVPEYPAAGAAPAHLTLDFEVPPSLGARLGIKQHLRATKQRDGLARFSMLYGGIPYLGTPTKMHGYGQAFDGPIASGAQVVRL